MFVSYMNRMSRFPIIILVVASMLMSACAAVTDVAVPGNYVPPLDAQVLTVKAGSVAYGIAQCLADKPGTQILMNGEQIMFTWGYEFGARGMFGIDLANKTVMNIAEIINKGGGLVNAKSSQDLLNWMKQNGWTTVTGAALGELVKASLEAAMIRIASGPMLALYIILPVGEDGTFDPATLPGFAPEVTS